LDNGNGIQLVKILLQFSNASLWKNGGHCQTGDKQEKWAVN